MEDLQTRLESLWADYCETFPKLAKFDCPTIEISPRLRVNLATNTSEYNLVRVAKRYYESNIDLYWGEIIPHELAHQIDYNLNSWGYRENHHRESWVNIMLALDKAPLLAYEVL